MKIDKIKEIRAGTERMSFMYLGENPMWGSCFSSGTWIGSLPWGMNFKWVMKKETKK